MEINFRSASNNDIDRLLVAMREFYALDDYAFDEKITRKALEKFIADDTLGRLWLIEGDNKTIGYVALTFSYSFEFHGRDAFVDELFIDASYRGQGIGKAVMRFIEEKCRELGVNALHLEVERENIAAQKLYRRFGFADHDRYLMTKRISG
jgi:ribosomal protein S18 acetylase RimI-like enzyme